MPKITKKRRQRMIDALLDDAIETTGQILTEKDVESWFRDIFGNGVKGYNNFTDEELDKACRDAEIERYAN